MVFLDMGGTLVEPHPSVGHIYARTAKRYGMDIDVAETDRVFTEKFRAREDAAALMARGTERRWWYELVGEVVSELCTLRSFDRFFEEVYEYFTLPRAWRVYRDVSPLFDSLRDRGIKAAIVSNWDSRLDLLCERLGIASRVEFIAVSALVGSAKPDAGIFRYALDKAGIDPGQAVHIGDSVDKDVDGARAAGIEGVLIDRAGRSTAKVARRITSLPEVLPLL
jgi:putative hydrolase of the HAD superfamily